MSLDTILALALGLGAVAVGWRIAWSFRPVPPPAPAPAPAELVELCEQRLGQQVHALCRWTHRHAAGPKGRWNGEQRLWMALTSDCLWLLYRDDAGTAIGGVHSQMRRAGLHPVWRQRRVRDDHIGELSWPQAPWFIRGELGGPLAQRLRLIGLLAADQLTLRREVTRAGR
jgi:hypothetical protein